MVLYSYKVIIFEIQFLFQLLFLHRFQRQRLKAHSATCKELAEKFIIRKTHGLNTDDQAFKTNDEHVTQNNRNPITNATFFASTCQYSQNKNRLTQTAMCHRKSAHTHIGKSVAQHADYDFKQFNPSLDQISANAAAINQRSVTFHKMNKHLREHHSQARCNCKR